MKIIESNIQIVLRQIGNFPIDDMCTYIDLSERDINIFFKICKKYRNGYDTNRKYAACDIVTIIPYKVNNNWTNIIRMNVIYLGDNYYNVVFNSAISLVIDCSYYNFNDSLKYIVNNIRSFL